METELESCKVVFSRGPEKKQMLAIGRMTSAFLYGCLTKDTDNEHR